jgi:5-deoxy-glucuronate isomerase
MTPAKAKWDWTSLRIADLAAGESLEFNTGGEEMLVLSLSGSVDVESGSDHAHVIGRPDVFSGVSDFVYIASGRPVRLSSLTGGRFAVPGARSESSRPFAYQPKGAIEVEYRGAGRCSRRVINMCTDQTFDADRIIVCEVVTPGGNWSSYPPHKHDEDGPDESELEEIYYFEVDGAGHGDAMAYQRVYGTSARPIDLLAEVRDRDLVLVPHGWHGPTMAVPGYDAYFFNVMAGPGARAWRICDDPAHSWIRNEWAKEDLDPRVFLFH